MNKTTFFTFLLAAMVHGAEPGFFPFVIKANGRNPAMDMSSLLPAPAGRDGFVRAEGDRLVNDAGPVRLNGMNLVGPAIMPRHDEADRLAERLSRLGINCIRMHYFDVIHYGSNFMKAPMPGIFKNDPNSTCTIDEERRDRLEYLVAALKKKGVYVDVNLHVGHELDERDGFPKTPWANRGVDFFYRPIIEKEKEYARNLLSHVNPYTGLPLAKDPCVAIVEINNENGMFSTWPNGLFDSPDFPAPYRDAFDACWNKWLASRYTNDIAAVEKAWGWRPKPFGENSYLRCSAPGPAYPPAVTNDFYRFLSDTDSSYYAEMRDFLRNELGVKCVVFGTQIDYCTAHSLAEQDAVDIHLYWTHPSKGPAKPGVDYRRGPILGVPWYFRNRAIVASRCFASQYDEDFVPHRMTMRVKGKPFLVSESSSPYPNWYGAEYHPFLHALAAFQGLSGVFGHSWNNDVEAEPDRVTYFFSYAARTDCVAHFPAMAAMFLRGDVHVAREHTWVNDSREHAFERLFRMTHRHAGVHSSPARATGGQFRSSEVLVRGVGVDLEGCSQKPRPLDPAVVAKMDAGLFESDTGEMLLDQSDLQHSHFLVRAPNTKLFTGFSSYRAFDLGDGVRVEPGANCLGWCTISLVSMDAGGFGAGARILLTATGFTHNGGAKFTNIEADKWHARDDDYGWTKTVTEGVRAKVVLPGRVAAFRALNEDGERTEEIPTSFDGKFTTLEIGPEYKTVWYEIRMDAAQACGNDSLTKREGIVEIRSSVDGTMQPCFVQPPPAGVTNAPLLVGLHSWSMGVDTRHPRDVMAKACAERGWAFVYPHYRGRNDKPEACGSRRAVGDVLDAVQWAQEAFSIDPDRVYVAGGSGGGHMALMAVSMAPRTFAAAVAFCPISDLLRWWNDGIALGTEYPAMLEKSCGGKPDGHARGEYLRRSPLGDPLAAAHDAGVKLYVAAGIHDGHGEQPVPIGHSIRAFNAFAEESDRISESDIAVMERTESVPKSLAFAGRDPLYPEAKKILMRRTSGGARLTLFEGGHQDNYPAAFDFLARQRRGAPPDWTLPASAVQHGAPASITR